MKKKVTVWNQMSNLFTRQDYIMKKKGPHTLYSTLVWQVPYNTFSVDHITKK